MQPFSFFSLHIKSFWPLLLEVTSAFNLRVNQEPSTSGKSWVPSPVKEHFLTWGQCWLCQTRGDCQRSGRDFLHCDGVCPPRQLPPHHGLAMVDLSSWLSLSLTKRVSPSGTWGKGSKPSTTVKAGNVRNWGTANAMGAELKLQCTEFFFS
jgi:hypothetical protein